MKIFFTGGTGLIGKYFITSFRHHQYTVLTRSPENAKNIFQHSVSYLHDLSKLSSLDAFDAVINLAGASIVEQRWTEKRKQVITESRCKLTAELVRLLRAGVNPPKVFLSGSAIGIYGDQGQKTIDETSATSSSQSNFAANLCNRWENISRQIEPFSRLIYLRTGIVLGGAGGALAKILPPFKLGLGGRIGDGKQYMSWIHIKDMVTAMEFLLNDSNCHGFFNMTAPNPATNAFFTRELSGVLNRPSFLPLPGLGLKIIMGEASQILLTGQRVVPKKLLEKGFMFSFPELKSALQNLLLENRE